MIPGRLGERHDLQLATEASFIEFHGSATIPVEVQVRNHFFHDALPRTLRSDRESFLVNARTTLPKTHGTRLPKVVPMKTCARRCANPLPSPPNAYSGALKMLSVPVNIAMAMPMIAITCGVILRRGITGRSCL